MAENFVTKKDKVHEVIFRWSDKKKKEDIIIGPVVAQAKTERVAIVKAAIKHATELLKADLLTLDVDIRVF